jgi:hypothetical protein
MMATATARRRDGVVIRQPGASVYGLGRPAHRSGAMSLPVSGGRPSRTAIVQMRCEPEGSVITVGDRTGSGLACYLTCAFASCLERELPLGRFPHVIVSCRVAVLRPGRSARAGFAGFGRSGGLDCRRADVPEPAADTGGGQPPGRSRGVPRGGAGRRPAAGPGAAGRGRR